MLHVHIPISLAGKSGMVKNHSNTNQCRIPGVAQ